MFLPVHKDLFFSKNDPEDIRLGDLCQTLILNEVKENDCIIIGYPDDDGIRLNGGRKGAAEAPFHIRQFLYKMTPSFKKPLLSKKIFDGGDLQLTTPDLKTRHLMAMDQISKILNQKAQFISLGGGHDYGYSDGSAFITQFKYPDFQTKEIRYSNEFQKPLILNFDAHLDVRPTKNGFNSGTPFFRLIEEFGNDFHLIEIGIQPQCNSPHQVRWAKERGIEIFDLDFINEFGLAALWKHSELKNTNPNRPVFISFDIDSITASEAGGCSQAWATGLKTAECLKFLESVYQKTSTKGIGVYEVSPPLDVDFQTSKTAALLVHHFIFNNNK